MSADLTPDDGSRAAPPGPAEPPSDYSLTLPEGWFRIPLSPEELDASVDALVERQFEGVDDAPHLKRQIRRDLVKRGRKSFRNGGIEFYVSLEMGGPLPIPASLVVTLVPPGQDALAPRDLAMSLAASGPLGQEVSIMERPTGDIVRTRVRTEPEPDDAMGNTLPVTSADYYLRVPRSPAILLLSFSTPLDPIAETMVELFDAIAGSLTWRE
ncbi:hypothetical protein ACFUCH_02350 [Streptomyces olivaceus]|uniref:hypothetical protein n=1 Tax=Streptomyces olivaceus TaxID=47716 RepID=UPI00363B4A66